VRVRGGRSLAGLFFLAIAYGCYSSVAPVPKIDPGDIDSGSSSSGIPVDSGCAPRKPWEGPGVTGVLPNGGDTAYVLSGDRYFVAQFDVSGDAGDPTLGNVLAWRESGMIKDLWNDAPNALGGFIYDDPGVTAVYISKTNGAQVIINRFRRWVRAGDQWPVVGSVTDDWIFNDAGPPIFPEEGGTEPWQGDGVSATYFGPNGATFTVISQNRGWTRKTSDPDPKNWTWNDAGFALADTAPFSTAPAVGGQRPFEGKGVTTAYYVGAKLFVISVDKLWAYNGTAWVSSGLLSSMQGWSSAPSANCSP